MCFKWSLYVLWQTGQCYEYALTWVFSLSLPLPPSLPPSNPALPPTHLHHTHTHTHTHTASIVKSFVKMTRYLLSQSGDDLFLLSERITQDPLENYFGKQRSRGGRCENPCFQDCLHNAVAIRAQRSLELDRVQGNCRRKRRLPSPEKIDATPLPKRKRVTK